MKKKIILSITLIIILLLIILILKYKNNQQYQKELENIPNDMLIYETIIKSAINLQDIKNCEKISDKELRDICIASVEEKFDPMKQATTLDDCKKLSESKKDTKEKRIDTCIYNIALKNAKSQDDTKMCDSIKDTEIKTYCSSSIYSQFDDMSKITTFEGCDTLKETKTESKQLRQDVCRYNRMKSIVAPTNYEDLCKKILTNDIQEICLFEYKQKFKK